NSSSIFGSSLYMSLTRSLRCISLAPARLDRYPHGLTDHVADPIISIHAESRTSRSGLKLVRCPHSLASFTLITRTPRACATYLAALPSTRAIPDRDVFYVAD